MMPNVTNFHPRRNEAIWKQEVKTYLKGYECEFSFQKVDGSIRRMSCTLQESLLPGVSGKTSDLKESPEALVVYDVENNGWRTIKYDKIISFKVLEHYVRSAN